MGRFWNWVKQHAMWLKWPFGLAVLAWVFYQNREGFTGLADREIRWLYFACGFALCGGAMSLTFVRWFLLVWALEFPFRLRDAFRLGFIGILFNYVGPGGVGGDIYKAVMIASEQTSRRTVAVATIVLDRILGLLALFIVGSTASVFQTSWKQSEVMTTIVWICWFSSIAGLLGLIIVLLPGATNNKWMRSFEKLPLIGSTVGQLLDGFALYQSKPHVLILAVAMSLVSHLGMLSAFYFCALVISPRAEIPGYLEHLMFVPAAEIVAMIPIFPGGVGAMELAMDKFYSLIGFAGGNGLLTVLVYRVITIVIGAIGAGYYFTSRKEIDKVLSESSEAAG